MGHVRAPSCNVYDEPPRQWDMSAHPKVMYTMNVDAAVRDLAKSVVCSPTTLSAVRLHPDFAASGIDLSRACGGTISSVDPQAALSKFSPSSGADPQAAVSSMNNAVNEMGKYFWKVCVADCGRIFHFMMTAPTSPCTATGLLSRASFMQQI